MLRNGDVSVKKENPMNQPNTYYKHSGAMGAMGLVYMVLFGSVGALVLGVVYGYAMCYVPFIYLNLFIGFNNITYFYFNIYN